MDLEQFAEEVGAERAYQVSRFGDGTDASLDLVDDNQNGPTEWVCYIAAYSTRWFPGFFGPWDDAVLKEFRISMIKVATLAYSAIKWVDRRLDE